MVLGTGRRLYLLLLKRDAVQQPAPRKTIMQQEETEEAEEEIEEAALEI